MAVRKTTQANRERIIAVAAKLIIERGVAHTTLADIAVAANISKGTLYYYYPTKGDLIFDIADRHVNRMTEKIFRWIADSGHGQSPDKVIRMVFDTALHSPTRGHIHLYLIQEALAENPSLRGRFIEAYARWRQLIEDGLARVSEECKEHLVGSRVLLAALDGFLIQRLLGVQEIAFDEISSFFASALK
ncbi:MAG: TetR/AcrR family transcriptional regulator [Alkalispirochaetaceae bacterium]